MTRACQWAATKKEYDRLFISPSVILINKVDMLEIIKLFCWMNVQVLAKHQNNLKR